MPLIIPKGLTTYADATSTGGGRMGKYVLAQFRSDAKFQWVLEARRVLVVDALKWGHVGARMAELRSKDPEVWKAVTAGIRQATIVVIDPEPVDALIKEEMGPTTLERDPSYLQELTHNCAVSIVKNTPVAYLPEELDRLLPWSKYSPIANMMDFTPAGILQELGGPKQHALLRKSMLFAARCHASFDLVAHDPSAGSTRDVFRSPASRLVLRELLSVRRVFDVECETSVAVLNKAAAVIAQRLETTLEGPPVTESSDEGVNELQAADLAAGHARELLDRGEPVDRLPRYFETVWYNGTLLRNMDR